MILCLLIGAGAGACVGALTGYFGRCSSGTCPLTANPYQGAVYGAVLGVVFAVVLAGTLKTTPEPPDVRANGSSNTTVAKTATKTAPLEALVHVNNAADFDRYVLNASKPCMADFYSDRCGPCRMLAPAVEQLAAKYDGRAVVCKVNLDLAPELAAPYRIMGIPAVLFFDGGKEAHRLIGLRNQPDYEDVLHEMLQE
jgi:thioredoxin 1